MQSASTERLEVSIQKTRPLPLDIPENIEDWVLHVKAERSINDLVHDIHKLLMKDDALSGKYRRYLYATYDEQAVEGSLSADNAMVALMIRERAKEEDTPVQYEKLSVIYKALGVVLRRYHMSRKERRLSVDGEIISDNHGTAE
jgi:hypothetical protein